ncbi:M20/M25/M40 family metallo-hydrolase [Streptococcus anginosus]|uniref:M20/M25/M40 family metallo-hydrolase n=1 Tax=Streptococcus anginosus TaxID=1328 RepID=A0ABD4U2A6_STRAP|nr:MULTISPECIES: M20/M25/M40 family metallo-hydrolase [Streptococcus]KAA9296532.1 M20/M25/M40 family metallo-hydrolase [Streptococcus anginosus]KUL99941.1 peptidase M20 [Streptococcus anginosus]MCW1060129.1 M20/M25/M40 family metallo-hydrolase [Streptococcus anginosus]MCW1076740.1 M20/M25/M40 family metallo-hydrolase [Streptococcus anginosus]MDB8655781.1 M20/M25/M40 family metallo-hydrolase [Streptococcus anginosus]
MTFSSEEEQIKKFEQDIVTQEYIAILRTLIAKKSIFAQQVGLQEVAAYLKEIFTRAGAEVELDDSYTAPFVIAKFKSSNPTAKTIIFYNHYDTVPADSDQIWTDDPFTLSIRDGGMYGRGVDDDKGHIIARLTAMQKYLQKHKTLPVNVIFMMEGAEESASVDLEKYLAKHKVLLQGADLLVWEQGIKNSLGQLEISGGNKGIVTFDMKVKSAEVDIHSSFGGVIDSASWYLLNALASLRDKDGCIQVEGLYDQVIAPNQRELALVEQYAQRSPEEVETIYGLELPLLQEEKKSFLNRIFFEPSLNIEGITSGYQGQGVKTILPSEASAKVEVRLVPGLEPHGVLELIRKQLDKNGFDKVELVYTLGEMSHRSDMSASPILNVIELAKKFYQKGVSVLPTTAGTGPMHTVFEVLEVPMVAFGLGNANSRDHGGDENVRIADYYTHIELVEELIASYE